MLVPRLPLEGHLKFMYVRSAAERQTFLTLMSPMRRKTCEGRVHVATEPLFERRATYIEEVVAQAETLILKMNASTSFPGPFDVALQFKIDSGRVWRYSNRVDALAGPWQLRLTGSEGEQGLLTVMLDGDLAFPGRVSFLDAPF